MPPRRATLDIPLIAGDFDPARPAAGVLVLDAAACERHLAALGSRIGAIPAHVGSRLAQRAARQLGATIAGRYAARLGVSAELLADAWYFSIWSELCTLIPLRHVARRVARIAAGATVVIPLETGRRRYLTFWSRSGLEPFYVAAELQRLGTPVAFCGGRASGNNTVTVRLTPDPVWRAAFSGRPPRRRGRSAVVRAGLRGMGWILARAPDPLLVAGSFAAASPRDIAFADRRHRLPSVELTLRCEPAATLTAQAAQAADATLLDLGHWLCELLGPATAAAAARAAGLVEECGLTEAHVCDHMFWESAIVAHAVRDAGGHVILWPHSSNAVHVGARRAYGVDRINCSTRTAAAAWEARFPEVPCSVVSDLILKPCRTPRPLDPTQPLTVLVIASGRRLNRLPVLDNDGHAETYRRLFRGLADCAPGIRFVCKARAPWEDIEWLQSLVGPAPLLPETRLPPTRIDLPNLVYVSVSFGSTALLEGLSRGIPCMVVREIPVEDYSAIGADDFPVGPVETILARLRECQDLSVLGKLAEAQLAWYARETEFAPSPDSYPR